MATALGDLRKLLPRDVLQVLNSTRFGHVLDAYALSKHRERLGLRIGDGRRVDLFKLSAHLIYERHHPLARKDKRDYEDVKRDAAERSRAMSRAGREIGELDYDGIDIECRAKAAVCFRSFCEEYFAETFCLAWSDDHLRVLGTIEKAVMGGGLFAMAMPRGSGKTSLCECACIWALLFGHRAFVCLIGSDESHASEMLDAIKVELETNDGLARDFPEVVQPIRALDGIAHRCAGQLYDGKRTYITWTAKEIVLPTIGKSKASGAVMRVAGITGRIRGMKYKRPDGTAIRPSLVILDDPQTDESSRSPSQCEHREAVVAGAILGLAGPGQKISGIMPCTVIRKGDMADRVLDREEHPEWQGVRTKMVYEWPANAELWDQYATIRAESLSEGDGITHATQFYREHREAMDEGSVVAWEERFNNDELSGIQHAMNLRYQDELAFFAEYQNEPISSLDDDRLLTADEISGKQSGLARRVVPLTADKLTVFIDVQQSALYYIVAAWSADFTGAVIDYGIWPEQHRDYVSLRDLSRTLQEDHPGCGDEAAIFAGLTELVNHLDVEWEREDGVLMRVNRVMVDSGWKTDTINLFCRQAEQASILIPAMGQAIGARHLPLDKRQKKLVRGERGGHHWQMKRQQQGRMRYLLVDVNYWKSFVQDRLHQSMGDPGCLTLWKMSKQRHRMFGEHGAAEYRTRTEGHGREVDEWQLRPGQADNHLLDCIVGAAAGASVEGCCLPGTGSIEIRERRPRMRLSDMRRSKG